MALRVGIADDSEIFREVLREMLEADGDITVAVEASTGREVLERANGARIDLWTIDLQMPAGDGLSTVEQLMDRFPTPIVVLTGQAAGKTSGHEGDTAFAAIRRGALDFVEKRALTGDGGRGLRRRIRELARVKVVRRSAANAGGPGRRVEAMPPDASPPPLLVALGASTGGPVALLALLKGLPRSFAVPLAIVQHLPVGYAESFARFLADHTPLAVVVVKRPTPLASRTIFLAPDDRHLVLHKGAGLGVDDAPPRNGHRPSVDVLFESVAATAGSRSIGVLLSGMGDDGARGLAAMRQRGATTIAQDEQSSAIYGMPGAAAQLSAARRILPVSLIGSVLGGLAQRMDRR